ncbi:hypothetical protein ABEB36_005515 [Hypothenemus hampei]|uniref:Uncharacterized protein n=1 Tax=Hypothenemus hampei TaxID=57062 RepID=A0ABD1EYG4_HYPHA
MFNSIIIFMEQNIYANLWKTFTVLIWNYNHVFSEKLEELCYHFCDEDAFKKRGTILENEYIRKKTKELIEELKKKIEKEKKAALKEVLEYEKEKLEETLNDLNRPTKNNKS